jgi:hypothetical protein
VHGAAHAVGQLQRRAVHTVGPQADHPGESALRTRALERRRSWEDSIFDELRVQFPDARSPLEVRVTVASVVGALYTAVDAWIDAWLETGGSADLTDIVRLAFQHLSTGLGIEPS